MERPVKERLVGAAVLMAAAIILIPEMLSGPDREPAEQRAQNGENSEGGGESGIKTYTIDLNQSPGALPPSAAEQTDNRAPPPEELPSPSASPPAASIPDELPPAEPQASPESVAVTPPEPPAAQTPAPQPRQSEPAPAVVAEVSSQPRPEPRPEPRSEPPPRQVAEQPARAEAPPPKTETPPARPVASEPAAPKSAVPAANAKGKGWVVQLGSYSSEATAQRLMNDWRAKGHSAFVMPVNSGGKTLYRVRIGPTMDRAASEVALKAVKASIPGAAVVAHP